MVLSFIDSGILIAAARGNSPRAQLALDILSASDRIFGSSIFIKLEVLPKSASQNISDSFIKIQKSQTAIWSEIEFDCWYLQLRTSLPTKGYILITFARDLI